ncbi:putative oxidoreductase C-terminal domain-containing protein [Sphingobacterium psychroaquaticum]|uniref:Oxidoreductase family, NAD-binding Rossmann fold n=1 Tax=Sphingobacterium psychroaquaticum TaxID=561061 RepID=A0A1X7K530_9SPHI|nr:putative oxidoreductase C-terminal domain-containing protein [Sphingobacterium psychroaquaticum]SMG35944.1 Oxidoreductase family, NAD-binding Rossmann fold [Sphingobacterium psychroaquaticum]
MEENKSGDRLRLVVLDPGHFHASLIQKNKLHEVDTQIYVYAPVGPEVQAYLNLVRGYNERTADPTAWKMKVYTNADFLEQMKRDKMGDVVVLAGNNKKKTDYIYQSIDASLHVLSDKPMAINKEGFEELHRAFELAEDKGVLLYDIMTERYNIFSILQKELVQSPMVFGALQKGSLEEPAILKKSVHHFYKNVSGKPLIRPNWYYDVEQEGDGIVDVTTHGIDLVQWQCFPEVVFDYKRDVEIWKATRYPTLISKAQYQMSTGDSEFADFLEKDIKQGQLTVYANGEIDYTLKGTHVKVAVEWNFQADPGNGDTHLSQIRGTQCVVAIKQGKAEDFAPTLYIEPNAGKHFSAEEKERIHRGFAAIEKLYPGIALHDFGDGFRVAIPDRLREGHEEHFAHVANKFFDYVKRGKLPAWEKSYMLTKYYITTMALEKATK